MSIEHCDAHGPYDTDYHVEGCPRCESLEQADLEADRQYDEGKLRERDESH